MVRWHQTWKGQCGLRFGGLAVLSLAWLVGMMLYRHVHMHLPREASLGELGLCAVLVVLVLAGNVLLCVGPGLWKRAPLPGRWSAAPTEARQFEVLLYPDKSRIG